MDEKQLVSQALSAAIDGVLGVEQIAAIIEKPKSSDLGDLAFPAFQLAKTLRKSPQIIAGEIAVIDFDAGLLGEFREDVVREVGRPGEDIEDLFLSSLCGPGIIGEDDAGRTIRTADDLAGRSGIPVATRCRCQRARRQQGCKNALDLFHSSLLFYFVRLDWYMENVLFFSCKKRTKKIRFSG